MNIGSFSSDFHFPRSKPGQKLSLKKRGTFLAKISSIFVLSACRPVNFVKKVPLGRYMLLLLQVLYVYATYVRSKQSAREYSVMSWAVSSTTPSRILFSAVCSSSDLELKLGIFEFDSNLEGLYSCILTYLI